MNRKLIAFLLILFGSVFHLSAQKIRVLSFNIHHGNPPSEKESVVNLDTIAQIIKHSSADLVGLQEIDVNLGRSYNEDQAKKLAELTGMHYIFSKGIDLEQGEYGTAILSKYPIERVEKHFLPSPVESERRSLSIVEVRINNKKILFANTHLDLKDKNKIAQAKFITSRFKNEKRPIILVGDLNSKPTDPAIKELGMLFTKTSSQNGFTFPQDRPSTEIDYIMVNTSSHPKFFNHRVIEEKYASDHRPLYVEIDIK
ncbi:MAG: endonuclease [Sphingobacterium sp.]|jgi:endonuclease/exonuclease/phosphatase family metal-dependent hydrolase|uniref:endonuclease/exonuclease/phosphatase family protein n=1 Tax=unclassified Sphingobacterium TaxID=2609468 RepID=UPI0009876F5A|nr:endonuclease/exonuclease/phosphatase family protein [Sphingobacterium sp. CZ-UAM]MDF2518861.1 endonuclease [Sphingobacterium sp.]OOG16425.1 endonuclease [Sphingobacterium sp. CZ-UAM]